MMSDRATMPAAAPGEWTKGSAGLDAQEVRVSFARARDPASVREQVESWHAILERAASRAALVPVMAREGDVVRLYYPAPRAIGANAIGAQTVGADPMAKYEVGAPKRVLWFLSSVATALDDIHARGIVHGALAFPSVWWMPDREVCFPDAALAHSLEGIADASPEVFVYRAPEVWHGSAPLPQSDQYSLAVMAYELFTGRSRKDGRSVEGILVVEPLMLEPNALRAAGAPPAIADVLQRAISASPRSRFESCTAFVAALTAAFEGSVAAEATGERRSNRRSRLVSPGGVALVLVAIAVIAGAIAVARNQTTARRVATSLRNRVLPSFVVPPRTGSGPAAKSTASESPRPSTMSRGRISTTLEPGTNPSSNPATPSAPSGNMFPLASAPAGGGPAQAPTSPEMAGVTAPGAGSASSNRPQSTSNVGARSSSPSVNVPDATARTAGSATRAISDAIPTPSASAGQGTTGNASDGRPNPRPDAAGSSTSGTATPPQGTIVVALPAGSRIYVDGVLSRTDARSGSSRTLQVAPGTHDVDILTPSGVSQKRRVTIYAGDTVRLNVPGK